MSSVTVRVRTTAAAASSKKRVFRFYLCTHLRFAGSRSQQIRSWHSNVAGQLQQQEHSVRRNNSAGCSSCKEKKTERKKRVNPIHLVSISKRVSRYQVIRRNDGGKNDTGKERKEKKEKRPKTDSVWHGRGNICQNRNSGCLFGSLAE